MTKEDLNIRNKNADLKRALAGQELSFGTFIVTAGESKLSVTGRYSPPEMDSKKRYVTLGGDLAVKDADYGRDLYYGVSPLFDYDMITKLISGLCLTDPDKLDGFIAEKPGLFMLHRDQGDYLPDFARYIVLSVLSLFAVRLKISAEEAERVKATGDFCPETASWEKTDESRGILTLYGCPTEKMLASLSDLRFRREGDLWASGAKEGAMLTEIYGDRENIALAGGKGTVFYSGTLIRPTHVECPETRYEDSGVSSVIVDFEKTTYATVFAMDGNYTGHPLLRDRRGKIVEFLRQDDREKGILIDALENAEKTAKERLDAVND